MMLMRSEPQEQPSVLGVYDFIISSEKTMDQAPEALVPLTSDSLGEIEGIDRLRLDPPRDGDQQRRAPQPVFIKVMGMLGFI